MALKQEQLIEEIGNMSVLELSQLVKALEEKFGVSAAVPVAAAPAAAAAAPAAAAEKSKFDVKLTAAGDQTVKVIKALRQFLPNLGLTEAKKLLDDAPVVVAKEMAAADAQKMKAALEAEGAKVELA